MNALLFKERVDTHACCIHVWGVRMHVRGLVLVVIKDGIAHEFDTTDACLRDESH